jgi:hypothetical protein
MLRFDEEIGGSHESCTEKAVLQAILRIRTQLKSQKGKGENA